MTHVNPCFMSHTISQTFNENWYSGICQKLSDEFHYGPNCSTIKAPKAQTELHQVSQTLLNT